MFQIKQPVNQQKAVTSLDTSISMLKKFLADFAKPITNNVKSNNDDRKPTPVESGVHIIS